MASAQVSISQNFIPSEDRLTYTSQFGITGTPDNATGVLNLTGTATKAQYETVLKSVRYQNIDNVDPIGGARKIRFTVTDPAGATSTPVERTIDVIPTLLTASMPYQEDLETDGEGTRYTSNDGLMANGRAFIRTNVASEPNGQWHASGFPATTITGINNSYYWWVSGTSIYSGGTGTFITRQTNTAGYINLNFSVKLAASNNVWERNGLVKVYYRLGGSSGTWVPLISFRSTDQSTTSNSTTGNLARDADPNTTTGAPAGAQLTPALTTYSAALPASANGQLVDFRIDATSVSSDGVGEVIAFDNLQLTGTPVVAPTVTTATPGSVTTTSAVLGGDVTADGGATVTGRGVVYSSTDNTPTIGEGGVTQDTNGNGTGTFSEAISGLTPGTRYYVAAYATNSVGTSYGSVLQFVTTPNAPVVLTPPNGALTNDNTPIYSGTALANSTVAVIVDGTSAGTATATAAGNWSFTPTTPLAEGSHTVRATASINGSAQSASSNTNTFIVDTTPPAAPVVTAPANGSSTSSTTPTYSGTAEANSTVTVIVDGSSIGTTTATAGGSWSLTQPTALAQGGHTVRATATDVSGNVSPSSNTNTFVVDTTRPAVAISSTAGASGSTTTTSPIPFTVTFSENVSGFVAGDVTVSNGSITGGVVNGASPGTVFTFTVTPTTPGTATTVNVPANVAQDAASNFNTAAPAPYSITYNQPNTTVVSVTRLTPNPTATATVSYRVVFASSVTGVTTSNFSVTSNTGASVSSVSGSGTAYTVVVNTGTGNGVLTLNVQNSSGISPTVTNVPYTSGEQYSITKNFAAAPTLRIQAAGSASGNGDVTAFVDVVQVLQSGTSTVVANGLQNGSFETNNVPANGFRKASDAVAVVAAPWSFTGTSGVARYGSLFDSQVAGHTQPLPPNGDAVALIQSAGDNNASISQNLAVPTGSYQVNFQTAQRYYTAVDQRLNVFVNDVFVGSIQPNNTATYESFTSASFSVTAPALTATVSSSAAASGGTTGTSPIPFSVSFSQSVGTSFTAADVTVTGGSVVSASFSGSGAGPYTFNVTPATPGSATTVSVGAGVAQDANNTLNSASNSYSVTFVRTAAPTVVAPANGTTVASNLPTYSGTAPAGSTVTVYVDATSRGTTTADGSGNWTLVHPSNQPLAVGGHTVYATAQLSGQGVSLNSNTNNFVVPNPATYTSSTTDQLNTDRVAAGSTNQEILRVAVVIGGGNDNPLSAQSFSFTTGGSTTPADIAAARVYYTGTSGTFATTTQFGSAVSNPNGSFTIAGTQQLALGTNYFFLVYDVAANATNGNLLDATVPSLTVGGTAYAPTVTNPAGNRRIIKTDRVAGTALRFAGDNTAGYVNFSSSPTQAPTLSGAYTQSVWIKPAIGTGSETYYVLGNGTGNGAAPYIYVTGNGRLGAGFGTGSATVNRQTSPQLVTANQWHHVVATYTGSALIVYLNGVPEINFATGNGPAANRVNFIGNVGTSTTANNFPGDIDEVSQWTKTLTQTEARLLRHLTLSGAEDGLVSYLQFNDSGPSTTDVVSGAVGALTGATRVTSTAPVGFGTSSLQAVSANGTVTFPGTNAAINFTGVSGSFEVTVARLDGRPQGIQPSGLAHYYTPAYWIINQYGTGSFANAAVTYTLSATDISPADAASPTTTLRLLKRASNSDGAFDAPIAATAANASGTVTFNLTSFSQTVIGTLGTSPLPVTLVDFTAERQGEDALIKWATSQEKNNAYFAVESSVDGREFSVVERRTGQGNSTSRHDYQVTDRNLSRYGAALVYYRLRQVDFDGTTTYSDLRTVRVPGPVKPQLALYPNPARTAVKLTGAGAGTGIQVFDAVGRLVLSTRADASGAAQLTLPDTLPTGVYVVRAGSQAQRLVVE
ncbi:Ig-like domain-containing protein [Hymenobacter edaphi]|nr:Ig-like domain-containing protein [Hymenobacter edaphi]